MSIKRGKFIYSLIYLLVLIAFTGCGSKLALKAQGDGSATVALRMDTGKAASATIAAVMDSLYGGSSAGSRAGEIFTAQNAAALEKSLEESDLVRPKVRALSGTELSLDGTVPDAKSQKRVSSTGVKMANLIRVSKDSLCLVLSPETLRQLYGSMDEKTRNYVDLFMAPAFTGEQMNKEEYLSLVASVYGSELAGELSDALLSVTLEAPSGKKISGRTLPGAQNVRVSGGTATFSLPVAELLILQKEQVHSIRWN